MAMVKHGTNEKILKVSKTKKEAKKDFEVKKQK